MVPGPATFRIGVTASSADTEVENTSKVPREDSLPPTQPSASQAPATISTIPQTSSDLPVSSRQDPHCAIPVVNTLQLNYVLKFIAILFCIYVLGYYSFYLFNTSYSLLTIGG